MAEFSLSSFADEASPDLKEQIIISKENGISNIELRGINGKGLVEYPLKEVKEFTKELKDSGMKVSALGSPFGKIKITDDFVPHFDSFKRAMEYAQVLETSRIRMFSFFIPQNENPDIYRDHVMERIEKFLDACPEGVSCYHENEKEIFGDTAERCLDILTTFSGRIKGIFDPANFIQCNVDPLYAYKLLESKIDYFHIKDAVMESGKVVKAGMGDGHIEELISLFGQKEGEHFLSIEPHLTVFKGFENLRDEVSLSSDEVLYSSDKEAYNASVEALKQILKNLSYEQNEGIWRLT